MRKQVQAMAPVFSLFFPVMAIRPEKSPKEYGETKMCINAQSLFMEGRITMDYNKDKQRTSKWFWVIIRDEVEAALWNRVDQQPPK